MSYQQFNEKILNYYLERKRSEFFELSLDRLELSLDRQEMESVISVEQLSQFQDLKSSWHLLLEPLNNIPQYFGLIAIQCYAASEMQSDEQNSASACQVRLREILLINEDNHLQSLFKGENIENPIQGEIWYSAKKYFEDNLNLKINIPGRTKMAGRYVQYPKSQALLNTEDLKYFSIFFSEEFQIGENVPFTYFKKKLNTWLFNSKRDKITKRAKNLLEDEGEDKRERCLEQIYNYFNRWDGLFQNSKTNKNKVSTSFAKLEINPKQQKLLLHFDEGTPIFYFNGNKIADNYVLNIPDYKYIYDGLLLFNESDYYPNEFEDSRFLEKETTSYVLIDPKSFSSENRYLVQHSLSFIKMDKGCMLYKFITNEECIWSALKKYIQHMCKRRAHRHCTF